MPSEQFVSSLCSGVPLSLSDQRDRWRGQQPKVPVPLDGAVTAPRHGPCGIWPCSFSVLVFGIEDVTTRYFVIEDFMARFQARLNVSAIEHFPGEPTTIASLIRRINLFPSLGLS